jgi:hypothetical protein
MWSSSIALDRRWLLIWGSVYGAFAARPRLDERHKPIHISQVQRLALKGDAILQQFAADVHLAQIPPLHPSAPSCRSITLLTHTPRRCTCSTPFRPCRDPASSTGPEGPTPCWPVPRRRLDAATAPGSPGCRTETAAPRLNLHLQPRPRRLGLAG